MKQRTILATCALVVAGIGFLAGNDVRADDQDQTFDPGTAEDREALFEFLVETTLEWDAFASLPNHPAHREHPKGIDVIAEMKQYRDELIAADTAEKMWFALHKISNARKDRHLRVREIDGGLQIPDELRVRLQAPIRFAVDYSHPEERFLFVGEMSTDIDEHVDGPTPQIGDRLVRINGRTAEDYAEAMRPYQRYSSDNHFWWWLGYDIVRTRDYLPHSEFYDEDLESIHFVLERRNGTRYEVDVPYLDRSDVDWAGYNDREYPGFSKVEGMDEYETYTLYRPDGRSLPVILLDWYGFRSDLPDAMDRLVEYGEDEGILDHHVIVDATRSRGGSNGAYALARLQPKSFRTTFGNLKVSEASKRWVNERIERWDRNPPSPRRGQCSTHIYEWFKEDVTKAFEQGRYYTNDVPFKGVQPKWGDGIIEPAERHFRGGMTVWLGPRGGSHLDQFASQVVDNDLAHLMGMPCGGFSNKWQTTEVLRFPTTGKPIVSYQWSMGHSIRANKQILQYNPAQPHEYIPLTRENYLDYHPRLLERTLERLGLNE